MSFLFLLRPVTSFNLYLLEALSPYMFILDVRASTEDLGQGGGETLIGP